MRKKVLPLALLTAILLLSACSEASRQTAPTETAQGKVDGQAFVGDDISAKNILQIAAASEAHSTLAAAVQAAGLENVLANNGPLTVFAPTNAAFEKLPAGTVENLLKPENRGTLANIITFHAAPGKYTEEMLKDGMNLFQATGHYVKVEKKDDGTYVNGAKLLASVEAANGIVHVVENVWLPPEG